MKQNWPVIILVIIFLAMGGYIYHLEGRIRKQEESERVVQVNQIFNEDSISSVIERRLQNRIDSVLSKKEAKIIYLTNEKKTLQRAIDSVGITSSSMPRF